jgi:hypothetical protein
MLDESHIDDDLAQATTKVACYGTNRKGETNFEELIQYFLRDLPVDGRIRLVQYILVDVKADKYL